MEAAKRRKHFARDVGTLGGRRRQHRRAFSGAPVQVDHRHLMLVLPVHDAPRVAV
jgi:hypothetical protein